MKKTSSGLQLDYSIQAENGSMLNTPPTYSIYVAGLVFQWLKKQGGLAAMERTNIAKAKLLYQAIDASSLYHNPVRRFVMDKVVSMTWPSRCLVSLLHANVSSHQHILRNAKSRFIRRPSERCRCDLVRTVWCHPAEKPL